MGENIVDNAGLVVAYDAYKLSIKWSTSDLLELKDFYDGVEESVFIGCRVLHPRYS